MKIRGIDKRRTEITVGAWKAIIVKRADFDDRRAWTANTRLYGAVSTFAPDLDEKVSANANKPASGNGDGFTDEERIAHVTEYKRLKREALATTKKELVDPIAYLHAQLGRFGTERPKAKFSAKAGCSMCPCSPGHILSTRWTLTGAPVDVWFERVSTAA